jgi:hypothetical protein
MSHRLESDVASASGVMRANRATAQLKLRLACSKLVPPEFSTLHWKCGGYGNKSSNKTVSTE